MKRQLGCLSPGGLLMALLVIVLVAGYTLLEGGKLFSPGPVTAAKPQNAPLQGYRSHAEFESQCTRCHRPWGGADPLRCVACHTGVRDQIASRTGLHGQLQNPGRCFLCHTEHQGRDADITAAALDDFAHQQVGFSLARHRPLGCADCHPTASYIFDQATCETCHVDLDAAFMSQHVSDFGQDCLACHDGSGAMGNFDHDAVFALQHAHAGLECTACHVNRQFEGLSSACVDCHEEPDVHRDQFGADCAACHSVRAWTPARLLEHTFPLDHESDTESECQVCHPTDYATYTCYECHEHDPAKVEREHLEEGIRDFDDCVECHPTGREDEAEHDDD